jgi:nicotinate-nucleotide pyrophosphorylase (carboxylating)
MGSQPAGDADTGPARRVSERASGGTSGGAAVGVPGAVPGSPSDLVPDRERLDALIHRALAEDVAARDVTTELLVPAETVGTGIVRAKADGVVAGLAVAARVFDRACALFGGRATFTSPTFDGAEVAAGDEVCRVFGHLGSVLRAERTALNFLQRASGIATLTRRYVEAVRGTRSSRGTEPVVLATRKTVPGLRELDLIAVRAGGAEAHRTSLASAVLLKENHLAAALCGGSVRDFAGALDRVLADGGPGAHVVEAAVGTVAALGAHAVLGEAQLHVEERLEVGLADQRRGVAGIVEDPGHAGSVGRQRHAVHPHAVVADVLAGDHRRPRRHAHHVGRMGPAEVDALAGQPVDHRRAGGGAAVAPQAVVALLIGGDEEDLPAHRSPVNQLLSDIVTIL